MHEPTQVRVGVMDWSPRPEQVLTVNARRLRPLERIWRAARRTLGVSGVLLIAGNVALMMAPFPHIHLCLFPLALVLGPVLGFVAWRDRAVLSAGELPCPRCHAPVAMPDGLAGWPARFNCERCGIRVELNPL
jgi:hypothetical protein